MIVAITAGLGGGYLAANIANSPSGVSKLERRMSAEPISVAAAPAQPVPPPVASNSAAAPARETQPQTQVAVPADNAVASSKTITRAEDKPTTDIVAVQPAQPATQSVKPIESKSVEQAGEKAAPSREAFAKARDLDLRRAEAEKRRAERRQAWAERRRVQPRDEELEAVEERVREVTEPRRIRIREEDEPREMFAEPARVEMPRIRLFDRGN
ncbi:hypothetical protein [Bradyrhizobium roseum]|uniref:hypothetical protein n=1 Tax=Bradyrhizobium roseum TaxID=3056648 RepID=UPI002630D785|nr:hypothetical protein [Bradyrhizobium roseus]WKA28069.1 hypothetical protein QUH67_31735 [Bradyrhizobium roseus]